MVIDAVTGSKRVVISPGRGLDVWIREEFDRLLDAFQFGVPVTGPAAGAGNKRTRLLKPALKAA